MVSISNMFIGRSTGGRISINGKTIVVPDGVSAEIKHGGRVFIGGVEQKGDDGAPFAPPSGPISVTLSDCTLHDVRYTGSVIVDHKACVFDGTISSTGGSLTVDGDVHSSVDMTGGTLRCRDIHGKARSVGTDIKKNKKKRRRTTRSPSPTTTITNIPAGCVVSTGGSLVVDECSGVIGEDYTSSSSSSKTRIKGEVRNLGTIIHVGDEIEDGCAASSSTNILSGNTFSGHIGTIRVGNTVKRSRDE